MNIGRRVKPSSSSRDRTAKLQTTRTISTETRTSSSTPRCRCATRMPSTQHRSQSPSASSGQQASQRHCRSIFIKMSILFPFFKPITSNFFFKDEDFPSHLDPSNTVSFPSLNLSDKADFNP